MEYFDEIQDRVILIGVQANLGDDMEESLDELGELAATAGAAVDVPQPYGSFPYKLPSCRSLSLHG